LPGAWGAFNDLFAVDGGGVEGRSSSLLYGVVGGVFCDILIVLGKIRIYNRFYFGSKFF